MSGIPIASEPTIGGSNSYLICDTGGLKAKEDPAPFRVYAASFVDKDIGQSEWFPSEKNTITVTLSLSVRVTPRMGLSITLAGLKGASALTGPLRLSEVHSFAGQGLPDYFSPSPRGARGYGLWDNIRKTLKLYVASELKPGKKFAFSFKVNNPQAGQASPTILVGIGVGECFPWAEPMATRATLFVRDIVTDDLLADTR